VIADTCPSSSLRSRRRRKQERAGALREAALALFVEKGFEATRTEEIAARAGTSKGTLYLYYPSKESLLGTVIDSPALASLAKLRPSTRRDGSGIDVLRGLMSDIWARLQDETVGRVLKLAVCEGRRFPEVMKLWVSQAAQPLHSLVAGVVLRSMDDGEFRQVDADAVAHSLLLPLFMSCLQRQTAAARAAEDRCVHDEFAAQHVELVLQGLVARHR
jgi:AcrR family transcriptional regulator